MAQATVTNIATGESAQLELELGAVGNGKAAIVRGASKLWETVRNWSPKDVGGLEFDLRVNGQTLRRCVITAGDGGAINFMSID